MEFNYEGLNERNNGGIMMYNYGLDHRELCRQLFVLRLPKILVVEQSMNQNPITSWTKLVEQAMNQNPITTWTKLVESLSLTLYPSSYKQYMNIKWLRLRRGFNMHAQEYAHLFNTMQFLLSIANLVDKFK